MDTLRALEGYLDEFKGVLVVVSHDRLFTDKVSISQANILPLNNRGTKITKHLYQSHDRILPMQVTNHLFVFEGQGVVKDYLGSLSDYAECLVEQEKSDDATISGPGGVDSETRKASYKEDKGKRLERRNAIKKLKRESGKIEPAIDKLKAKVVELQTQMDKSASEGWTVLADLSQQVEKVKEEIEEKEVEWLDMAEKLETLEEEENADTS